MASARVILSNTMTQVAGKVVIAFLGLITSKLLATYLRVEERGLYEYTYNFLAFISIAADMGLYTIAIREISKKKEDMEKVIGNILTIRNTLSLLMLICAMIFVYTIPALQKGPQFTLAVLLAGVATVLALLNGTLTSVLQVEYKMFHATVAQVLGKIVAVTTMAVGVFLIFKKSAPGYDYDTSFWGFEWLLIAGVLGNLILATYTWYHARKIVKLRYHYDFSYWKYLFHETFLYGLALILGTLYFKIDIFILGFLLPATGVPVEQTAQFQIGIYSASVKVVEIFAVLPLFFLNALLPTLTKRMEEGGVQLSRLLQYSLDFLYMLACPLACGGYALAYHIIHVTNSPAYLSRLQDGFLGSDITLRIIIFTFIFSFVGLLFNFVLVAQKKQKTLIIINLFSLFFNTLTNIILIPHYGIFAAACTTVITECIVCIFSYYAAKRSVDFTLSFSNIFKITCAGLAMGGAIMLTSDTLMLNLGSKLGLLIILLEAGLIYGLALVLSRVVTKDMLALLKKA